MPNHNHFKLLVTLFAVLTLSAMPLVADSYGVGDYDGDCDVDLADYMCLISQYNQPCPTPPDPCYDITGDGVVNIDDLAKILVWYGRNLADFDDNGEVNAADAYAFDAAYVASSGSCVGDEAYNIYVDIDGNGCIDVNDAYLFDKCYSGA